VGQRVKLYFVRHGKDDGRYRGGWSSLGLTLEGIAQTERLAAHLKQKQPQYNINRLIASDLERAKQTATIIGGAIMLPVEYSSDWREIDNGELAGMENTAAEEKYPDLYFNTLRLDQSYPRGESPKIFFERIKAAFKALCKKSADENILIATHGGVINIVYHLVNNIEWDNTLKPFPAAHTSIHLVECNGKDYSIEPLNIDHKN
jgi:probable phosphoglycerate mutase